MIIVKKECCGNKTYVNYLWNSWISLTWQDVVGRVRQAGGCELCWLNTELLTMAGLRCLWSCLIRLSADTGSGFCDALRYSCYSYAISLRAAQSLVIQSLRALNTEHNAELMPNALISCWLLFCQLGLVLVLSASRCYLQFYLHSAHLICPDTLETTQTETSYLLT